MLSVINRHPDSDVTAEICLAQSLETQAASVEELNGPDITASNSFSDPSLVSVRNGEIEKFRSGVTHTFPAHSLTVIDFECVPD
jgi:alpha-N-arabinofuranosidase